MENKKIKIKKTLNIFLIGNILITIFASGLFMANKINLNNNLLNMESKNYIDDLGKLKAKSIDNYLENQRLKLITLSEDEDLKNKFENYYLNDEFEANKKQFIEFENVFLMDKNKKIIFSSEENEINPNLIYEKNNQNEKIFSDEKNIFIISPVIKNEQEMQGIFFTKIEYETLNAILEDNLTKTKQFYLLNKNNELIYSNIKNPKINYNCFSDLENKKAIISVYKINSIQGCLITEIKKEDIHPIGIYTKENVKLFFYIIFEWFVLLLFYIFIIKKYDLIKK